MEPKNIFISEYSYPLPAERIAETPLEERDNSKLLIYNDGNIIDRIFHSLPEFLPTGATLVVNNTRVIEARLFFQKETGAQIEIFCLSPYLPSDIQTSLMNKREVQWNCMIGGASKWKPGQILQKQIIIDRDAVELKARYVGKSVDQFIIEFTWNSDHHFAEVLHAAGAIPLPPYIKRKAALTDAERYQTVFAQHRGSVAAPTAALHFTPLTFEALQYKKIHTCQVTLHVGAGTFKPVKTETIAEHSMHGEYFTVTATTIKKLIESEVIIAVGTTSLRTLESLHWIGLKIRNGATELDLGQWEAIDLSKQDVSYKESLESILRYLERNELGAISCTTSLLIMPGYRFHSAHALVTNFHQPKSTLLLLIAAFIGEDWKKVYEHALENNYRFLSYGDSSLLWRR